MLLKSKSPLANDVVFDMAQASKNGNHDIESRDSTTKADIYQRLHTQLHKQILACTQHHTYRMSFFGMGGRPQLSSEQKIAQAEAEIDMVSDMYSRYVSHFPPPSPCPLLTIYPHTSLYSRCAHYDLQHTR